MKTEKRDNASSQNIMQVFQNANNIIAESASIDEMITAYDKVIKFCAENSGCRNQKSTKYYEKALNVAVSDKQKSMAMESMLDVVAQENLRVSEKCHKILKITKHLIKIYRKNEDVYDLKRISELSLKTKELLKKAGE